MLGPAPDSAVDLRLGRARFFRVVDTETGQQTTVDNAEGVNAVQGAGVQAAQVLARLGEIIERIRAITAVPVAVLTNGSLLWQKGVREEVALADVVLPSLDAPDAERFEFINRPHPQITFERLVDGLEAFRREFPGQYWLEVMFLDGYTTLPPQVCQMADWARRIHPDRVQLNTPVRPSAEEYAVAVSPARLAEMAKAFSPPAEVIAEHQGYREIAAGSEPSSEAILALLRRRPGTIADLAQGLGIKPSEAVKCLAALQAGAQVHCSRRGAELFYRAQ
jgi:wyosine [tRNA(Phe)-imidazoG37] synthetase (radical SAM superfamily)